MMSRPVRRSAAVLVLTLLCSPAMAGDGLCTPSSVDQIFASDGEEQRQFGKIVSIDGDRVLVGAWRDDHQGDWTGSANIFERTGPGNQWTEVVKLTASDADEDDQYGTAVSLCGDIALIGSPNDDDLGANAGAVYVYERDESGAWIEVQKLFASDGAAGHRFGRSVAHDGDTAVIGAAAFDGGRAYVFRQDKNGVWQEIDVLSAVGTADFGFAVAILGDTIVVGAPATGDGVLHGAAVVFREGVPGEWIELASWSDAGFLDAFGITLAMNEDTIGIGNLGLTSGATVRLFYEQAPGDWRELPPIHGTIVGVAIDGDTMVVLDFQIAKIFHRDAPTTWTHVMTLNPFGPVSGFVIDVSGFHAVMAAIQDHTQGQQAGTAYIFDIQCEQPCEYDLNNDGQIGPEDLAAVLKAWGPCDGCAEDFNADGYVSPIDLASVLGNWGPCS